MERTSLSKQEGRKAYVACVEGRKIFVHTNFVRKHEGQKPPQRLMQRLGNNFNMNLQEIRKVVDRVGPAQNRIQWWTCVNTQTYGKILYQLNKYQFLRKSSAPCGH